MLKEFSYRVYQEYKSVFEFLFLNGNLIFLSLKSEILYPETHFILAGI